MIPGKGEFPSSIPILDGGKAKRIPGNPLLFLF